MFTRLDGQALAIDNGRIGRGLLLVAFACRFRRVRAAVEVLEVLGQFDGHLTIRIHRTIVIIDGVRRNNADVPIAEIVLRCFLIAICLTGIDITDNIQLLVQLNLGRLAEIITKLQAVIESGNGMLAIAVRIVLVDNAGDVLAVDTRCTIFTRLTLFGLDDGRRDAVFAVFAIQADRTVFAVYTILASFTDCNVHQAAMEGIVDFTARDKLLRAVLGRVIRG